MNNMTGREIRFSNELSPKIRKPRTQRQRVGIAQGAILTRRQKKGTETPEASADDKKNQDI